MQFISPLVAELPPASDRVRTMGKVSTPLLSVREKIIATVGLVSSTVYVSWLKLMIISAVKIRVMCCCQHNYDWLIQINRANVTAYIRICLRGYKQILTIIGRNADNCTITANLKSHIRIHSRGSNVKSLFKFNTIIIVYRNIHCHSIPTGSWSGTHSERKSCHGSGVVKTTKAVHGINCEKLLLFVGGEHWKTL